MKLFYFLFLSTNKLNTLHFKKANLQNQLSINSDVVKYGYFKKVNIRIFIKYLKSCMRSKFIKLPKISMHIYWIEVLGYFMNPSQERTAIMKRAFRLLIGSITLKLSYYVCVCVCVYLAPEIWCNVINLHIFDLQFNNPTIRIEKTNRVTINCKSLFSLKQLASFL